jgi:hypothetical protein
MYTPHAVAQDSEALPSRINRHSSWTRPVQLVSPKAKSSSYLRIRSHTSIQRASVFSLKGLGEVYSLSAITSPDTANRP